MGKLFAQLRRNQVAFISVVIACSSLVYGAWRNEVSEDNRNLRAAGFEIIREIAGLERVVFFAHYDKDEHLGNPRQGWSHVMMLTDLAQMQTQEVQQRTAELKNVWQRNWSGLGKREDAVSAISEAIDNLREATKTSLASLE